MHVVEERSREAIDLCRQALSLDPNHYRARIFLGMLLDDEGTGDEKDESRQHFIEAIKRVKSVKEYCASGYERTALYHLGLWELFRDNTNNASLLFLADYFLCPRDGSDRDLSKLLDESLAEVFKEIFRLTKASKANEKAANE